MCNTPSLLKPYEIKVDNLAYQQSIYKIRQINSVVLNGPLMDFNKDHVNN